MSDSAQSAIDVMMAQLLGAVAASDWSRVEVLADAILILQSDHPQAAVFRHTARALSGSAAPDAGHLLLPPAPRPSRTRPPHAHSHEVAAVAEGVVELTPFSPVAVQLLRLLDDDLTTTDQLARLAGTDPALTARILSVANSAFYRRRIRAATLREALVVLGAREMRSIVIASCVISSAPRTRVLAHREFWRYSLAVGVLADLIAHSAGSHSGEAFTAGVMHGIGLLALDLYCPEGLEEVRRLKSTGMRRLRDRELEVFGFTNEALEARLAERWNLPPSVVSAIASYGRMVEEFGPGELTASAIARARIFALAQGLGDGLEVPQARVVTDEWLHAPVNTTLAAMGGWEAFLARIDAFLEQTEHKSGTWRGILPHRSRSSAQPLLTSS